MKRSLLTISIFVLMLFVSSASAACSTGLCKDCNKSCNGDCSDIGLTLKGLPITGTSPVNYAIGATTTGSVSQVIFKVIDTSGKVVASGSTHCPVCISKNTCSCKGTIKNPGIYDVQVTAYKNSTCCKTVNLTGAITVNAPVKCSACFNSTVAGKKVNFNPSCSTGTIKSVYWSFGDGYASKIKNPTHTYKKAGSYKVCLTVYGSGCPKGVKACQTITV